MDDLLLPSKRLVFTSFLDDGHVHVRVDARKLGVMLPRHLIGESGVILLYGRDLPKPIPDLAIDDAGIHATLSFGEMAFKTFVPWSAIYAIYHHSGKGFVSADDVPKDSASPARENDPELPSSIDSRLFN